MAYLTDGGLYHFIDISEIEWRVGRHLNCLEAIAFSYVFARMVTLAINSVIKSLLCSPKLVVEKLGSYYNRGSALSG